VTCKKPSAKGVDAAACDVAIGNPSHFLSTRDGFLVLCDFDIHSLMTQRAALGWYHRMLFLRHYPAEWSAGIFFDSDLALGQHSGVFGGVALLSLQGLKCDWRVTGALSAEALEVSTAHENGPGSDSDTEPVGPALEISLFQQRNAEQGEPAARRAFARCVAAARA
jgi:hypothetical protein